MEPNKLEKQIREQLNSREIKPSEAAWDRLDAMLSVAEGKKPKRSFGWLYIAASILVLVTAGTLFFNQNNATNTIENQIGVTNDTEIKSTVPAKQNEDIQENINQNQEQVAQAVNQKQQSSEKNRVSIINQKSTVNQTGEGQNHELIAQKESSIVQPQTGTIFSKVEDTTVDNLLASAQKKVKEDKKTAIKVNVDGLLSQVDGELDQTFRERVVSRINKNYQEVKVALESRNQK